MWRFAKKACKRGVEWAGVLSWWRWSARSVIFNATVTQYTSSVNGVSLPTDYPHGRVTVHGCIVRSPLTGCQVTSRSRDRFLRYSKWTDTFRTVLVCISIWPAIIKMCHTVSDLQAFVLQNPMSTSFFKVVYFLYAATIWSHQRNVFVRGFSKTL